MQSSHEFDIVCLGGGVAAESLAGNAGGGVKWYGSRWGLRADYRFLVVRSVEFVPDPLVRLRQPFFGTETRFAHRVFGGVILKID